VIAKGRLLGCPKRRRYFDCWDGPLRSQHETPVWGYVFRVSQLWESSMTECNSLLKHI
jgi:hypothetical protein